MSNYKFFKVNDVSYLLCVTAGELPGSLQEIKDMAAVVVISLKSLVIGVALPVLAESIIFEIRVGNAQIVEAVDMRTQDLLLLVAQCPITYDKGDDSTNDGCDWGRRDCRGDVHDSACTPA